MTKDKQLITEIQITIRIIREENYRETELKRSEVVHRMSVSTPVIDKACVNRLALYCSDEAVKEFGKPLEETSTNPSPDAFIESV